LENENGYSTLRDGRQCTPNCWRPLLKNRRRPRSDDDVCYTFLRAHTITRTIGGQLVTQIMARGLCREPIHKEPKLCQRPHRGICTNPIKSTNQYSSYHGWIKSSSTDGPSVDIKTKHICTNVMSIYVVMRRPHLDPARNGNAS
jgi:hypothetical protein